MSEDALRTNAVQAYPGYGVTQYFETKKNPKEAVEIWMERAIGNGRVQRLFDPYTGEDLGNSVPAGIRLVSWMTELHLNLTDGGFRPYRQRGGCRRVDSAGIQRLRGLVAGSSELAARVFRLGFAWAGGALTGICIARWASGLRCFVRMWGITGIYAALPGRFAPGRLLRSAE